MLMLHMKYSPTLHDDLKVLPLALAGICIDAILMQLGIFQFAVFPLWLLLIWVGFIWTLGHSLKMLRKLPIAVLAPLGAVAGTSSYLAGWRFGAVAFPLGVMTTGLILVIIWALLLPLMVTGDKQLRCD
jgi:hypothetical protein